MIKTQGVDHVGLSVPDLEPTTDFFVKTLGFEIVGGRPEYPASFVSDGSVMITLWQTEADPYPFDRIANVGLHHLALTIGSMAELNKVFKTLESAPGVEIECAPIPLASGSGAHMMCIEPGGIRIEFITRGN